MRTDLELWLIVEENFDRFFSSGLCGVLRSLYYLEILTSTEIKVLKNTLYDYAAQNNITTNFFWNEGSKRPRKMFIQKQILKALKN